MTLAEIYAARQDAELQEKLASVAEVLGDSPEVVNIFDTALDMVKQAGVEDPSEQIEQAYTLTVEYVSGLEKEAGADESDDGEIDYGVLAAAASESLGITMEDLEKVASDEESEDLGRLISHRAWELIQNEE